MREIERDQVVSNDASLPHLPAFDGGSDGTAALPPVAPPPSHRRGSRRSLLRPGAIDSATRTAWLAWLERWTELPLTVLALALIPIVLGPYLLPLSPAIVDLFDQLDNIIWGVFAADLIAKVTIAPHRARYLRDHWPDLLLVVLPMLRPFRLLRSATALQLLAASRSLVAVSRVLAGIRRLLARRGIGYVLVSALITVIGAAILIAALEEKAPGTTIRTFGDGLWWAITTITTVGYGDTYPVTSAGRGVGIALMVLGIALFGVITAHLAAFFAEAQGDDLAAEVREMNERLRRIEEKLDREP